MPTAAACACAAAAARGLRLGRRRPARLVAGARGSRCLGVASAGDARAFAAMPGETVADARRRPAGRRATRLHRAALRRRAQHAGRRSERRASSCACSATRWSAGAGSRRPAAAARRPRQRLSRAAPWPGSSATARRSDSRHRVDQIERDGHRLARRRRQPPTRVVLACQRGRGGAAGSARTPPRGQRRAGALRYEPIVTVYARSAGMQPARADARAARRRRRAAGAVRLRSRPARRPGRPARLRDQRRGALGRARHRGHRGGDVGAGKRASWPASCARRSSSCGPSSKSARPSPARPAWSGRRWMSPPASSPAATTSPAPIRRRSKARSAAASRRRAAASSVG